MAVHPYGASLSVDEDSNGVYTTIFSLVSMAPPKIKVGSAESTVLNSGSPWRTFIPGFIDGDSFNFTLRFQGDDLAITENYDFFLGLLRSVFPWRIILPVEPTYVTGARLDFSGFLTENGIDEYTVDGDEVIDVSVTAKITGAVTFTPAS